MLDALSKTLGQCSDGILLRAMAWTLALAVSLILALCVGVYFFLSWFVELSPWLQGLTEITALLGSLVIGWVTFPTLSAAIAGLFADSAIEAVEKRYYPDLAPAIRRPNLLETVLIALKLTAIALLGALLALPFLLVPFLYILIVWGLNGWLLGREYFYMVTLRRLDLVGAQALYSKNRGQITLAGILIALALTLPLINLFSPILSAAFMVHIVENMVRDKQSSVGNRLVSTRR